MMILFYLIAAAVGITVYLILTAEPHLDETISQIIDDPRDDPASDHPMHCKCRKFHN